MCLAPGGGRTRPSLAGTTFPRLGSAGSLSLRRRERVRRQRGHPECWGAYVQPSCRIAARGGRNAPQVSNQGNNTGISCIQGDGYAPVVPPTRRASRPGTVPQLANKWANYRQISDRRALESERRRRAKSPLSTPGGAGRAAKGVARAPQMFPRKGTQTRHFGPSPAQSSDRLTGRRVNVTAVALAKDLFRLE